MLPSYQGQGIGKAMMEQMMAHVRAGMREGYRVYCGMHSDAGVEGFHERFGFEKHPHGYYGHGMAQWIVQL